MKIRQQYILTIISIILFLGCTKDEVEGPLINDIYGFFEITQPLTISNKNPDFSTNEVVKFQMGFNKNIDWKISITGLVSGSNKVISGFSNSLDSNLNIWNGTTSQFPFFEQEYCAIELTFLNESDTLRDTIEIMGPQLYTDGFIVADFENGFPTDAFNKPQGGNTLATFVISDDVPLLGNYYFQMGGMINYDWALGKIEFKLDYSSNQISSSPDDFYLNLGIFSDTVDLHTGQFVNVLISESDEPFDPDNNGVANIFDSNEEVYKLKLYIDWEGWKLISIRYSDFVATNSTAGVVFERNPNDIKGMRIACQACPSGGSNPSCPENLDRMVRTDLDHIIFTENDALFEVITNINNDEWNKN
jgi:hypothetical protein